MIRSLKVVDEAAVKKEIEAQTDWTAHCPICGRDLVGTLADIRKHGACHNDK